jgi:hypothetical protein
MKAAYGEASQVATHPSSCGLPTRPAGWRIASTESSRATLMASGRSSWGNRPGAIALTRIPSDAH